MFSHKNTVTVQCKILTGENFDKSLLWNIDEENIDEMPLEQYNGVLYDKENFDEFSKFIKIFPSEFYAVRYTWF